MVLSILYIFMALIISFGLDFQSERFHLILSHFIFPISAIYLFIENEKVKKAAAHAFKILTPFAVLLGIKSFYLKENLSLFHWFHLAFILILTTLFILKEKLKREIFQVLVASSFILIIVTGTISAVGIDYFNPNLLAFTQKNKSTSEFNKKIRPIIQKKCLSCHNSSIQSGNLDLTKTLTINGAGKTHKFIHTNLYFSGFFRRTFLMSHQKKHMPKGRGRLSRLELEAIEHWSKTAEASELGAPSEDPFKMKTPSWILKPKSAPKNLLKELLTDQNISSVSLTKSQLSKKISLRLTGLLPRKDLTLEERLNSREYSQHMTSQYLRFIGYKENLKEPKLNLEFIKRLERYFETDENYLSFLSNILSYKGFKYEELRATSYFTFQKFDRDEEFDKTYTNAARASLNNLYQFTLGARMDCAKCHDHRYAPISNADYYNQIHELGSFFDLGSVKDILENSTKSDPKTIYLRAFVERPNPDTPISIDQWLTDLSPSGAGFYSARQYVNFVWSTLNGASLIKEPEDHFHLSKTPPYIGLLNSLTFYFLENSLSTKKLIKRIVQSDFYKNELSYHKQEDALSKSTRLNSEMLRDNLLLLVRKLNLKTPRTIERIGFSLNQNSRSLYYLRQGSNLLNIDQEGEAQLVYRNFANIGDALFLNNKELMTPYLKFLSKRFPLKTNDQLERTFLAFFNRLPLKQEVELWEKNITNNDSEKIFLHGLISSNEFGYMK